MNEARHIYIMCIQRQLVLEDINIIFNLQMCYFPKQESWDIVEFGKCSKDDDLGLRAHSTAVILKTKTKWMLEPTPPRLFSKLKQNGCLNQLYHVNCQHKIKNFLVSSDKSRGTLLNCYHLLNIRQICLYKLKCQTRAIYENLRTTKGWNTIFFSVMSFMVIPWKNYCNPRRLQTTWGPCPVAWPRFRSAPPVFSSAHPSQS